jgi:hypothetical protein
MTKQAIQSDRVLKQAVEEAWHHIEVKRQELLEAQELHRKAVDAYELRHSAEAERLLEQVRELTRQEMQQQR